MGRAFLLDFEKKPTVAGVGPYYICRTCQTHIALLKDRVGRVILNQPPNVPKIFFKKAVNVIQKDDPDYHRRLNRDRKVAIVCCVKCTTRLGMEYTSTLHPPRTLHFKYTLQLDMLILKNRGQLLNSITGKPYTEEPHPNA